jgi:hypothetical protein
MVTGVLVGAAVGASVGCTSAVVGWTTGAVVAAGWAVGVSAGALQAANRLAMIETTKRLETNFLKNMVFFLLRKNGVKVEITCSI